MKKSIIVSLLIFLTSWGGAWAEDVVVWSQDTGALLYSSPVVLNGVVYLGNDSGTLYAMNSATGEILWQFESGKAIRSKVAISDDIICAANGTTLYGLNLQGEALWQFEIAETTTLYFWDFHHCSPNIVDGVVYIGAEKGKVFGVDIQTGKDVFSCQTPDQEFVIRSTPAVYNNKIYFGNWDGVFFAYDLATAEQVWSYDTKNDQTFSWDNSIQDAAVVYNNAVHFAGKGCILYALDTETGDVVWKWRDPTDQWLVGGPAIDHGMIVQGSSNQDLVFGFNADTGEEIWQTQVDGRVFDAPLITEDYIYAPSGSFYALDKTTGELKQRFDVEAQVYSTPALDNGLLYFGTENGMFYALDQAEFVSRLNPKIVLKTTETIDLGDVAIDQASVERNFYVYNTGSGPDSVWIKPMGSSKIKKAVVIEPLNLNIAAGDSQEIKITLNPADLKTDEYSFSVRFYSSRSLAPLDLAQEVTVNIVSSISGVKEMLHQPEIFTLNQNYPNPFNPTTCIEFNLPESGQVLLNVFNVQGELVTTLLDGFKQAGNYQATFNGTGLAGGVYYCQLNFNGKMEARKMLLLL